MAVTPSQFMAARPEFGPAGTQLVAQALAAASAQLDQAAWGALYDQAVSLQAAHLLWSSPFGATIRLDGDAAADDSRYSSQLARLRLARIPRIMVLR